MKNPEQLQVEKSILLLFPHAQLGEKIVQLFLRNDYDVFLITQEKAIQARFSRFSSGRLQLILVHPPTWRFREQLTRKKPFFAKTVIYFSGGDFLKLNSSGKNEEWRIDHHQEPQIKFSLIDQLLHGFEKNPPRLWVNLAIGMGADQSEGMVYCKTRYGLTGFSKILEMNPAFTDTRIINICLTYFKHRSDEKKVLHCEHCLSDKLNELLVTATDEDTLGDYLLRWSDSIHGEKD